MGKKFEIEICNGEKYVVIKIKDVCQSKDDLQTLVKMDREDLLPIWISDKVNMIYVKEIQTLEDAENAYKEVDDVIQKALDEASRFKSMLKIFTELKGEGNRLE